MAKLLGSNDVIKQLSKEIRKISRRSEAGLLRAGEFIKNDSQKRTPVDTGNLRADHYVTKGRKGFSPIVEIGVLSANYAVPVHERIELNHPTGEAKFLENAVVENKSKIISIIKESVKIK